MRTRRITWPAVAIAMALNVIPSGPHARALQATDVQSRIEQVRNELADIGEKLEVAGGRLSVSLDAVVRHRKALAAADKKRASLRQVVDQKAAQLYMIGTEAEYAIGQDVSDIADRLSYLEEMDRGSRGLLEEIRTLEEHATAESAELETALAEARGGRAELSDRRREVASRLADLSRLYDFLQSVNPRAGARASRGGVRGFVCPVIGPTAVRNNFGAPRPGGPHTGNDMSGNTGQGLGAVLPGTIVDTPRGGWIGVGIVLRDLAGNEWLYAHLSAESVTVGETVSAGEFVGHLGCSGNCWGSHLHFEYHPGGGGPVDPYRILSAAC